MSCVRYRTGQMMFLVGTMLLGGDRPRGKIDRRVSGGIRRSTFSCNMVIILEGIN